MNQKRIKKSSHLNLGVRCRSSYLDVGGTLSNSKKIIKRCTNHRPCKRTDCSRCIYVRKNYLLDHSLLIISENKLNCEVIVNFPNNDELGQDAWYHFRNTFTVYSKSISGRIGPFIRTLGIGGVAHHGHTHYMVNESSVSLMRKSAHRIGISKSNVIVKPIYDPEGMIGYFFDKNFLIVSNHPEKIRGLRVMSGSRFGMTYGYPRKKHIEELHKKQDDFNRMHRGDSWKN